MPSVRIRENEYFDSALRRFKRACEKAGILTELRRREYYEKPTQERKRKKAAAVKRHAKKMFRENARRTRLYKTFPARPDMALKDTLQQDMKTAMRGGDKPKLAVIRLILAAIKQREVDERIELDDTQVLVVLDKMCKQRRESISQFEQAGRDDLAALEKAELQLIQQYLPEQLTETEINELIDAAMQATGASSMKDMGKVMGQLKPKLQGRADMGAVSALIKARLG